MGHTLPSIRALKFPGLITDPNSQTVELGSFKQASNVFLVRDNIVQGRRGIFPWSTALPVPAGQQPSRPTAEWFFDNTWFDLTLAGDLYNYDATSFTLLDTGLISTFNSNPALFKINNAFASTSMYMAGGNFGVRKILSGSGPVVEAGVPAGLDGDGTVSGSTGWMPNLTNVNYQIVFGKIGINNQLYLGTPSDIVTVVNNSGTAAIVTVEFTIPDDLIVGDIYQIYRSAVSPDLATPAPSDAFQVFQGTLVSADISAKLISFTDQTPIGIQQTGTPLYTNQGTGEGSLATNDRPPSCIDIAFFQNVLWYANTYTKQIYDLSLVSTGAPDGLQDGDTLTVTINGTDVLIFTGSTSAEDISTGTFFIDTADDIGTNLATTAQSLIRVCNRWASNTFIYMDYESGILTNPGQIRITARTWSVSKFTLISSRGTAWFPLLPSSGVTEFSTNTSNKNYLRYSKELEPDAVPQNGTNFIQVGTENYPILRCLPLVNSMIVFKQGEGTWRITGTDATSFIAYPLDPTLELVGPKTAVILNNSVVCSTNQGMVQILDDGSAPLRSRNVETDFKQLQLLDNFMIDSWAMPYETERQYIVFVPSSESSIGPDTAYVWNYLAEGQPWTTYKYNLTSGSIPYAGLVTPSNNIDILNVNRNRMYLACANPNQGIAIPSTTITFGSPSNGSTVVVTTDSGPFTFTKVASAPGANQFTTIDDLTALIDALAGIGATNNGTVIAMTVNEQGLAPNSWTLTGTSSFNALNITFSGGTYPSNYIYQERKTLTKNDIVDEEWTATFASIVGNIVTLAAPSDFELKVGLVVTQGFPQSTIVSVQSPTQFTLAGPLTLGSGTTVTIGNPIEVILQQNLFNISSPEMVKQFSELFLFFRDATFTNINLTVLTDFYIANTTEIITPAAQGQYGTDPYGNTQPYGGGGPKTQVIKGLVPENDAIGHWLVFGIDNIMYKQLFLLEGIALSYTMLGTDFAQQ